MSNNFRFVSNSNSEISQPGSLQPRWLTTAQTSLGKALRMYRERARVRLSRQKLAELVAVSDKTIRNWEDDISVPTSHHLKVLLEVYLRQGLFTPGEEEDEAQQLWLKRQDYDTSNMLGEFDRAWFGHLLNQTKTTPATLSVAREVQDSAPQPESARLTEPEHFIEHSSLVAGMPLQLTSFIGREEELTTLRQMLMKDPPGRLLTLLGPGGVGKTRLALQLALAVAQTGHFKDGVYFVSLDGVTEHPLVPSLIAERVGLPESVKADEDTTGKLESYFSGKKLLLILDNFEHVLETRQLVLSLLQAVPGLQILITSRIPLGVYGEQQFEVSPFAFPDIENIPSLSGLLENRAEQVEQYLDNYPALRLLVERARLVRPSLKLTASNLPALVQLCRLLDGLPLALELAAARFRIISPQAMLERFNNPTQPNRLNFLIAAQTSNGSQSLRETLDWSYSLLDPEEQRLFRQLGTFWGGMSLEAIEAVCAKGYRTTIFKLLQQLCDHSMLQPGEDQFGEPRFYMLQTLREYALERLRVGGEERELRHRHMHYFLELAQTACRKLEEGSKEEQFYWHTRLEDELDNLRAVLCRARDKGEATLGLGLVQTLKPFWEDSSYQSEGRVWLEQFLSQLPTSPASKQ